MSQEKLKEKRVVITRPAQVAALKAIYDGQGPEAEKLGWDFSKSGKVTLPKNQAVFQDGRLTGLDLPDSVLGQGVGSKDFFKALAGAELGLILRSAIQLDEPDGNGNYIVRDPDEVASLKAIYEKINPAARRNVKIAFTPKGTARADSNVLATRAGRVARLDLSGTEPSDLSPLAGLAALTELDLKFNRISDLAPLAGLAALTELRLEANEISDLAPLAGLAALTELGLQENRISDLAPLAGLTALTYLSLNEKRLSDLTSLAGQTALTGLDLDENLISDLAPLAGLKALRYLDFTFALDSGLDLGPLLEKSSFVQMILKPRGDGLAVRLYFKTN